MIKIDKNIPMPAKATRGNPKYPFRNMKIGDSFSVSLDKEPTAHNRINVATNRQHRTTDRKYTMRTLKSTNEIRVWRVL